MQKNILLVFTDGLQRIAKSDKEPLKNLSQSTEKLEVSHYFLSYFLTLNMPLRFTQPPK